MELVLNTNGIKVSKRNNCFFLQTKHHKRLISPKKITSIAVLSECFFSTASILLAIENQIPIVFYSKSGKAKGRIWSPNFQNIATLRRKQIAFANTENATQWIIKTIELKHFGQNKNIKLIAKKQNMNLNLIDKWGKTENQLKKLNNFNNQLIVNCRNNLMGIEGNISKIYWEIIADTIAQKFGFKTRTRRPATDIFNAILNYFYGMLYGKIEGALISVGLDPYLGFLHTDEYQKPTLAFDVIEPFRYWADKLLIEIYFENNLQENHFDFIKNGYWLNKEGKKYFIPRFNDFLEERCSFNNKIKIRKNHIIAFAKQLINQINKDITNDLFNFL